MFSAVGSPEMRKFGPYILGPVPPKIWGLPKKIMGMTKKILVLTKKILVLTIQISGHTTNKFDGHDVMPKNWGLNLAHSQKVNKQDGVQNLQL